MRPASAAAPTDFEFFSKLLNSEVGSFVARGFFSQLSNLADESSPRSRARSEVDMALVGLDESVKPSGNALRRAVEALIALI
jgi:hypothetical protein